MNSLCVCYHGGDDAAKWQAVETSHVRRYARLETWLRWRSPVKSVVSRSDFFYPGVVQTGERVDRGRDGAIDCLVVLAYGKNYVSLPVRASL